MGIAPSIIPEVLQAVVMMLSTSRQPNQIRPFIIHAPSFCLKMVVSYQNADSLSRITQKNIWFICDFFRNNTLINTTNHAAIRFIVFGMLFLLRSSAPSVAVKKISYCVPAENVNLSSVFKNENT